jgi:L-methionine (R)-S-oxide reductase
VADSLTIDKSAAKHDRYAALLPQLKALVEGESDLIANLANIVAALHEAMDFFWIGVYFVKGNELVLGPFQGPVACTRIAYGKGVCGTAWKSGRTVIVPDVDQFPGHIACSSLSRSEIVVPVFKDSDVAMVLDADSDKPASFDETDQKHLEAIARLIEKML